MTGAATSAESPGRPHSASAEELQERLAADRRGEHYLVLRDGDGRQRIVRLADKIELVIGRSESADIRLDWDDEVSRVHAKVERLAGHWALVDDGMSLNGTFVNRDRLRGRRVLADGDTLRVGETHILFRSPIAGQIKTTAPTPRGPGVSLTPAQLRVLLALCQPFAEGRSFATPATNAEIARDLHLSVEAVKGHVRMLFRALGVSNVDRERRRTALAERAFATGTVSWRDYDPPDV